MSENVAAELYFKEDTHHKYNANNDNTGIKYHTIKGISLSRIMSDVTYFESVSISSKLVSLDLQY